MRAWEEFLQAWSIWAERERRDRPVRTVYEHLLKLRSLLEGQTEQYQLLVTDGLLTWDSPVGPICHPVLGRRIDLTIDNTHQQIRLVDTANSTLPLFDCLRGQAAIAGAAVAAAYAEVRGNELHPLDDMAVALLIAIRNRWFHTPLPGHPVLTRYPMLVLVPAADKASPMLEGIINDLTRGSAIDPEQTRTDLPPAIRAIVGDADAHNLSDSASGVADSDPDDPDQHILFTKPANVEQARIVAHLRRSPSAVVLGPPGTGKTHTIANLIGHFLAEGKTVLVTSETAKALGEVRNKVVPDLQPLCVPLLTSDQESRNELSKCVNGIVEHLQESTMAELTQRAVRSEADRETIARKLQGLRHRVLDARMSEITPIVIGGDSFEPIDAAKWIAGHSTGNDWIPPEVRLGVSCPLSPAEVDELYALNCGLSPADDQEYGGLLPAPSDIPKPDDLERLIEMRQQLSAQAENDQHGWLREALHSDRPGLIELRHTIEDLARLVAEPWKLGAINDGTPRNPRRRLWDTLLDAHQAALTAAVEAAQWAARHLVELGEATDEAADGNAAREIRDHLRRGGSLTRLSLLGKAAWRERLDRWRVDRHRVSRPEHLRAIETNLSVRLMRRRFLGLWRQLISAEGGPQEGALGPYPERAAVQAIAHIRQLLDWRTSVWKPLADRLHQLGVDWEALLHARPVAIGAHADLKRDLATLREEVLPRVNRRLAYLDLDALVEEHRRLSQPLATAASGHARSELLPSLLESWSRWEIGGYRGACTRLQDLHDRRPTYDRRHKFLARLIEAAPSWAAAVEARRPPHDGPAAPGDSVVAWRWRQFVGELGRRSQEDLSALLEDIQRKSQSLLEVTAKLVKARAWARQHERAVGPARRALQSWLDTMQALGAGHGQRVPELLAKASKLLVQARGAVPVWIMPLERVYQVIDPAARPRFDVVIVDEASQVGPDGLALLYLGERVVVVGDDQQVTPSAIGETNANMAELRAELLEGIPSRHLYEGKRSLYGLAREAFSASVSLREHFRCVPDIIRFSNSLCYVPLGQGILPLREAASARVFPPLVPHRVQGVREPGSKVNPIEARRIAALLGAMVRHPAYQGLTFGAVSLLGADQSLEIERFIRKYLGLDDTLVERLKGGGGITRRLCGEPPNFQGDERTVMLLSLVDSPDAAGPLRLVSEGNQLFRSRYNVAASRAQDQLWVVYSMDPSNDLQNADLRRKLIEHALNPQSLADLTIEAQERAESPFEEDVIAILIARGFRVVGQYPVGAYRIDLVIADGVRRLAIECDGERTHPPEKLREDMRRQAVLERRGWKFVRIRGSAFYRDRQAAMAPVFARIEQLGIQPRLHSSSGESGPRDTPDFVVDIVRRAEELEREWESRDAEEQRRAQESRTGAGPEARRWRRRRT